MSSKNSKNVLPKIFHDFSAKELFLYSRIPFNYLESFITGRFKPNVEHREKLSYVSRMFYGLSKDEKRAQIERKKFRAVRNFLSFSERDFLFDQTDDDSYCKILDQYVEKYWKEIVASIEEKRS